MKLILLSSLIFVSCFSNHNIERHIFKYGSTISFYDKFFGNCIGIVNDLKYGYYSLREVSCDTGYRCETQSACINLNETDYLLTLVK